MAGRRSGIADQNNDFFNLFCQINACLRVYVIRGACETRNDTQKAQEPLFEMTSRMHSIA